MKHLYWCSLLLLTALPALACSYDGQFNNPFNQAYNGSLRVALATNQAITNQKFIAAKPLTGPAGLQRAQWLLKQVIPQLNSLFPQPIDVLLIDKKLWAQVRIEQEKPALTLHTASATGEYPVVLMSEATLIALSKKQITLGQASELGILTLQPASQ
ncbi:hypothetical protein [Motilimonas eburnea]|uniref:hypothetical protein n=1 Tax=Motilimonas eburnea TaxID=1737488 RepID=UPI001E31FCF1|nr:hypothetical protein [Motilimonas eburnea]MCE2573452.1 hypothetical protein [Motilimonas eburnea]